MIRIVSIKSVEKSVSRLNLLEYSNELVNNANYVKGFLKSDTYWVINCNNCTVVTISEWNSSETWKKWYLSDRRKNIEGLYKKYNFKQKFFELNSRKINDDIFLL